MIQKKKKKKTQAIQPRNSLQLYKTKDKIAIAAKTIHKDKKKKKTLRKQNLEKTFRILWAHYVRQHGVQIGWSQQFDSGDLTADWLWAFELAVPPN